MSWPRPEFVLYILGAFLVGYGISLSLRAARARRWKDARDTCKDCGRPWTPDSPTCTACGVAPPVPIAIKAALRWVAAGIGVSILGVGVFLGGVATADWLALGNALGGMVPGTMLGPFLGGGLGLSLFGLYVAVLAYRGQRSRGRRRCPKCWYLIDEALGLKCSECGHEAARSRDLFRPRRREKLAVFGLLLIALGQLGWLESRVRRGGWIAAVPTEVLIIGMPWVPEEWLWRQSFAINDDWTLLGRIASGNRGGEPEASRMWAWQRGWATDRAADWTLASRNTSDALDRVRYLWRINDRPISATQTPKAHAAMLHALRLGLDGLSDPSDPSAGSLLPVMSLISRASLELLPDVESLVNDRTPALLTLLSAWPDGSWIAVETALGLGDGRPEVIEALAERAATDPSAAISLGWLADRHPHAAEAVIAMLRDPTDPRRPGLARVSSWAVEREAQSIITETQLEALASSDVFEALYAARTLIETGSSESALAAFDAAIQIARTDSTMVREVLVALGYNPLPDIIAARASVIQDLAESTDPELRRLALALLVSHSRHDDPVLNRLAITLIEAGVPAEGWTDPADIEALKERFRN